MRKNENESTIKQEKSRVHTENFDSRQWIGSCSNQNNSTISQFRSCDLNNKQTNAANMYSGRKQAEFKRRYDRDTLH